MGDEAPAEPSPAVGRAAGAAVSSAPRLGLSVSGPASATHVADRELSAAPGSSGSTTAPAPAVWGQALFARSVARAGAMLAPIMGDGVDWDGGGVGGGLSGAPIPGDASPSRSRAPSHAASAPDDESRGRGRGRASSEDDLLSSLDQLMESGEHKDADARNFLVNLAKALHCAGCVTHLTEQRVTAAAEVLGVDAQVACQPNSLFISLGDKNSGDSARSETHIVRLDQVSGRAGQGPLGSTALSS